MSLREVRSNAKLKLKRTNDGSISIFAAVIFLCFVVLAGVLVDAAGIRVSQTHADRAVNIAVRSVLSEYDIHLKEEYGLFAISKTDDEIEEKISTYAERILVPDINLPIKNWTELYDFKVEDISVDNGDALSLNNLDIFENQIKEYMKYRAPLGCVYDFADQVEDIHKASSSVELIHKATAVYKELSEFDRYLNDLRKYCDGWYFEEGKIFKAYEPFIKSIAIKGSAFYASRLYGFLNSSQKETLINNIYTQDQIKEYGRKYLEDMDQYVYNRCIVACLKNLKKKVRKAQRTVIGENKIQYYAKIRRSLSRQMEKDEKQMSQFDLDQYFDFYDTRQESCNNALESIRNLRLSVKDTLILIEEVEQYISMHQNDLLDSVLEPFQENLIKIEELIDNSTTHMFTDAEESITENQEMIGVLKNKFIKEAVIKELEDMAQSIGLEMDIEELSVKEVSLKIQKLIRDHKKYQLSKTAYKDELIVFLSRYHSEITIEPFSASEIKSLIGTQLDDAIDDHVYKDRNEEAWFNQDETCESNKTLHNQYIIERLPSYIYGLEATSDQYESEISNPRTASFSVLKKFKEKIFGLRDHLYVNEYMMTFFKTHITPRLEQKSFFNHEVEYILYGHNSDSKNYQTFKTRLFLVRSGLNLLHIYSDPVKRVQTMEAAAAATGGVGAFFAQFIIASGWAGAEADVDLDQLVEGEKIAFLKNKENWMLSFEAFWSHSKENDLDKKNKNARLKNEFEVNMFSYDDYLRLFLLFQNQKEKLYRSLDLIQINMKGRHYEDFETRNYLGACRVDAQFSIKYMFLNNSWMPEHIKNAVHARKKIDVTVEHCY